VDKLALAHGPFDNLPRLADAPGAGVTIDAVRCAAALVIARADNGSFARRFRAVAGVPLPPPRRRTSIGQRSAACIGPGKWMVYDEDDQCPLAEALAGGLAGLASITDQSDALAIVRVGGSAILPMMAKCVAIDLAPPAFETGSSAVTMIALMRAFVSQIDDRPTYDVAVPRSLAGSLLAHLGHYGREFGVNVRLGASPSTAGSLDA